MSESEACDGESLLSIKVHLFGGEKDGDLLQLDVPDRPEMIYACRTADDRRVWRARGPERMELIAQLGVLAYEFSSVAVTAHGTEYRYQRRPERDKRPA